MLPGCASLNKSKPGRSSSKTLMRRLGEEPTGAIEKTNAKRHGIAAPLLDGRISMVVQRRVRDLKLSEVDGDITTFDRLSTRRDNGCHAAAFCANNPNRRPPHVVSSTVACHLTDRIAPRTGESPDVSARVYVGPPHACACHILACRGPRTNQRACWDL